jgi:hypothetical protein
VSPGRWPSARRPPGSSGRPWRTTGLSFLDDRYDPAVSGIRSNRALFTAHLTDGASQIRVASKAPHPGVGGPRDRWTRYEAAINRAYAEFPLWGRCAYDTRASGAG